MGRRGGGAGTTARPECLSTPNQSFYQSKIMKAHLEPRKTMNGKPILRRAAKTVLTTESLPFQEKLLCDGLVLNLGDACAFSCTFCYVGPNQRYLAPPLIKAHNQENGTNHRFTDVVIRRENSIQLLHDQLLKKNGSRRYPDPEDRRVVYSSTLIDVAANMDLLRETAEACNLILKHTSWHIRLLSKSSLLSKLVSDLLIPEKHHGRLILGFSTGTLDDRIASAIEKGTSLVSKRLKSLHWLQDAGIRTFGMICPSLPQEDYDRFSREACEAIRVDRCEHVWAEIINVRGKSLSSTVDALKLAGLQDEAERLQSVCGKGANERWESYARETFIAHAKLVPAAKLRFLQYVNEDSTEWWAGQRDRGAVSLGKGAMEEDAAPCSAPSFEPAVTPKEGLTKDEAEYLEQREKIVILGVRASIATAKALFEIHSFGDGRLWKAAHPTFEAYCRARWDLGKSQAYRLIECGKFVAGLESGELNLSPFGDTLPKNEGQIRPLLSLPEEHRMDCWEGILAEATPADLTAREVKAKVRQFAEDRELPGFARSERADKELAASVKEIDKLRKRTSGHANHSRISALLTEIVALLA